PVFVELETRGRAEFVAEESQCESIRSVDLRYQGQGYELSIPYSERMFETFHEQHRQRYGFADEGREMEIVNVARENRGEDQELPTISTEIAARRWNAGTDREA